MKKIPTTVCAFLMAGCASKMPETHYQGISELWSGSQKCYQTGRITPKMYADLQESVKAVLATWDFDGNRLDSMSKTAYSRISPTESYCRDIEVQAHRLNSQLQKRSQSQASNTSYQPKTVQCKKMMDLSGKIHTFSGTVCPFGYY